MENSAAKWQLLSLLITIVFGAYIFYDKSNPKSETAPKEAIPEESTISKNIDFSSVKPEPIIDARYMNVLYLGVDNPIEIKIPGISSNQLQIAAYGGKIRSTGSGNYSMTVSKVGQASVEVSAGGIVGSKVFRAKRLPDPTAFVEQKSSGNIGQVQFKAAKGVYAEIVNFDFNVNCKIQGFQLQKNPGNGDEEFIINMGGRFNEKSTDLINSAKPGDIYIFDRVKARCPGDAAGRLINSMVFRIK